MNSRCPYCDAESTRETTHSERKYLAACTDCLSAYLVTKTEGGIETEGVGGDMRQAAPMESVTRHVLQMLVPAVERMPVFPDISHRILKVSGNPRATMSDLADIIREDTVVAASVLRAANSALYGGLGEITSLDMACTRLGIRTLCGIVQTVVNERHFTCSSEFAREAMDRLWRHSLVAAYGANEIALMVSEPNPDAIYLGGLFHDVGKVALLIAAEMASDDVVEVFEESPHLLDEVIQNFHGLAGLHIVQEWKLANDFALATYAHHDPSIAWTESSQRKLHILALADAIATQSGFGSLGEPDDVSIVSHPSTEYLNLSEIKMANLSVELEEKFDLLMDAYSESKAV